MLDAEKLVGLQCYFGGGTAVALLLDEYRESVDVDFMCSDKAAYRRLRSLVFDSDIDALFSSPIAKRRQTRADMDGVRNFIEIDGEAVKFEIVHEGRIELDDSKQTVQGIPTLSTTDLFAQKLLANTDRGFDSATNHRDLIDVLALSTRYGGVPAAAWAKAEGAYGTGVRKAWHRVIELLVRDARYFENCLLTLSVEPAMWAVLGDRLAAEASA